CHVSLQPVLQGRDCSAVVKVTGLSQSRNTTAQGTGVQLRRESQKKEADHPEHRSIMGQKHKIKIRSGNRKHLRPRNLQEPWNQGWRRRLTYGDRRVGA
ncbi:unnamed protein product, partial [Gulo gulo]